MDLRNKLLAVLLAVILTSVTFFVVFNAPAPSVSAESKNWLSGWTYRKSHYIYGSPGAGTDYQVKITAHYTPGTDSGSDVYLQSSCQKNFDDVRFTDGDGVTPLDYWLETKTDGNTAVFWVKINGNLDTDQTIFIYYGNKTVTTASNMDNTFPFADDFSSPTLDPAKWRTFGSGNAIMTGTNCTLATNPQDNGWIYILGNTLVGTNYSIRFRSLVIEQGQDRWTHHGFATIYNASTDGGRIDEYPNYITMSQESVFYAWSLRTRTYAETTRVDISNNEPAKEVFYTFEIERNGTTNVIFNCNDIYQGSINNAPTKKMGAMFGADSAGSPLFSVTVIDWVFIRKYVANEPLQGIWGAEEAAPSNSFFGALLKGP